MTPEFKFLIMDGCDSSYLPKKSEGLSTGYDVRSTIDITLSPGDYALIPLGFNSFCPSGWWYYLYPRSSTFIKRNMICLTGVVDESWEGQTCLAVSYMPPRFHLGLSKNLVINKGDTVGQIIPCPRHDMLVTEVSKEEFDQLCKGRSASRGSGGFGSTTLNEFKKS